MIRSSDLGASRPTSIRRYSGWSRGSLDLDRDAKDYLERVRAEDGAPLEIGIQLAIDGFVRGCKLDGIWSSIKASCILAGARTLGGALVPLVGTAPTSYLFESADYDRATGLKGDGAGKYLDTNRAGDADPLTDLHASVWQTQLETQTGFQGFGPLIASRSAISANDSSQILDENTTNQYTLLARGSTPINKTPRATDHLVGLSLSGTSLTMRYNNSSDVQTISTSGAVADNWQVLGRGSGQKLSTARLSFYSIGESLDLSLLDTRVSNLMTAISGELT